MKKFVITFFVLFISNYNLYSQNRTIKGRIINNHFETMSFVTIIINDTIEVGKTDLNGFFQLDIPVSEEKIVFRSVGLEPMIIKLIDTCNEVEVVMLLSSTYDFVPLKKVNRFRMKKFKKLPELHKEAFEKGLFKSEKVCFIQEFISHHNN